MAGDSLAVAVTAGLGFSVLAGIFSGICYVISRGFPKERKTKPETPWHCVVCSHQFRSIHGILDPEQVVTCQQCNKRACRNRCSTRSFDGSSAIWKCTGCRSADPWFYVLLNMLKPESTKGWYVTKQMDKTTIDEIDEDMLELQKKEREQVRDFIERLVGSMLGGDLDNVSVKKLYNDEKYGTLFQRYHDDISVGLTDLGSALHISIANLPVKGQSPCTAHAALKSLLQRLIQEAAGLPQLETPNIPFQNVSTLPEATGDRTYEDLMSTAIINKVVENSQRTPSEASSSRLSKPEYFLGERNLDFMPLGDGSSSVSSLDEWVRGDSPSSKYVDKLSLTIKESVDEPDSSSSEDDPKDDEEDSSWQEENWYLQKRTFKDSHSPVPVPMLVPNPTHETKVLIGDREAEDTTDLSDADITDDDEIDQEVELISLNSTLVNNRTLIGGKNALSISDDSSTDTSELNEERDDVLLRMENEGKCDEGMKENCEVSESLHSLDSNTEQDQEYTEKYATLPRTILKPQELAPRINTFFKNDSKAENGDSGVTSDEDEKQRIFKGSYSERDKEKWNHPVEMSNNPYSKANLEKRLSVTSSPDFSLDRDYLVRQSSRSRGTIAGDDEDASQTRAIPAAIRVEDNFNLPSSIEPSMPTQTETSSDSDFSAERTYNLRTGDIIVKKPANKSKEPEGIVYRQNEFDSNEVQQNRSSLMHTLNLSVDENSNDAHNTPTSTMYPNQLVDHILSEKQYKEMPPITPVSEYSSSSLKNLKKKDMLKLTEPETATKNLNEDENIQLNEPCIFEITTEQLPVAKHEKIQSIDSEPLEIELTTYQIKTEERFIKPSEVLELSFDLPAQDIQLTNETNNLKLESLHLPQIEDIQINKSSEFLGLATQYSATVESIQLIESSADFELKNAENIQSTDLKLASQHSFDTADMPIIKSSIELTQKSTETEDIQSLSSPVESETTTNNNVKVVDNAIDLEFLEHDTSSPQDSNDVIFTQLILDDRFRESFQPNIQDIPKYVLNIALNSVDDEDDDEMLDELEETYFNGRGFLQELLSQEIQQEFVQRSSVVIKELDDDFVADHENQQEFNQMPSAIIKELNNNFIDDDTFDDSPAYEVQSKTITFSPEISELQFSEENVNYLDLSGWKLPERIIPKIIELDDSNTNLIEKTDEEKIGGSMFNASVNELNNDSLSPTNKVYDTSMRNETNDALKIISDVEIKTDFGLEYSSLISLEATEIETEYITDERQNVRNESYRSQLHAVETEKEISNIETEQHNIANDVNKSDFEYTILSDPSKMEDTESGDIKNEQKQNIAIIEKPDSHQKSSIPSQSTWKSENQTNHNSQKFHKTESNNEDVLSQNMQDVSTKSIKTQNDRINRSEQKPRSNREKEIFGKLQEIDQILKSEINQSPPSKVEKVIKHSVVIDTDNEIKNLEQMQLVQNLLGKFSKSTSNLNRMERVRIENENQLQCSDDFSENIEIRDQLQWNEAVSKSVEALHTQDPIHSITARNIPKQMRKELKETTAKSTSDIVSSRTSSEEVEVFPNARSRIKFFETLKQ